MVECHFEKGRISLTPAWMLVSSRVGAFFIKMGASRDGIKFGDFEGMRNGRYFTDLTEV